MGTFHHSKFLVERRFSEAQQFDVNAYAEKITKFFGLHTGTELVYRVLVYPIYGV